MFVQDIFLYLIVTRHKITVRVNFKEKLHIGVGRCLYSSFVHGGAYQCCSVGLCPLLAEYLLLLLSIL
jgi:hypothetical protein